MPIPGDYPGMTNSQLDSYISDFLTAIYGEEVRDKFARIAYLIGHQIPDSVEPSVQAAAASAAEAAEEAENAANQAEAAEDAKTAASQSAQQAADAASESQESASSAASAAAAAEAAQEAAENAAQTATDAAGGDFLPKSGGTMQGDINMGNHSIGHIARLFGSSSITNYIQFLVQGCGGTVTRICGTNYSSEAQSVDVGNGVVSLNSTGPVNLNSGTGTITANNKRIQNVASPTASSDAANKAFVEESTKNVESAKKLSSAKTIDGVAFDGSSNIIHYGTCSTAAATAVKVVQCDGFKLAIGARIAVKFTYKNTYAASPVQLNVNGTGAKYARMYDDQHSVIMWEAGAIVEFIYDGSQYLMKSASTAVTLVNTLPVSKGGTGATTAAQALANLGVFNADPVYSKRVTVFGQTSSDNYIDLRVYKIGFVCFVQISSTMQTDGSNGVTFQEFELPETCKPLTSAMGVSAEVSGNKIGGMTRWEITGDLKLKFTASNPASWFERHCCFSYTADNSGW